MADDERRNRNPKRGAGLLGKVKPAGVRCEPSLPLMIAPGGLDLPELLTVDEVAAFLRKSLKGTYAAIERGQIPGVVKKPGLPLLVRRDDLRKHVGLT